MHDESNHPLSVCVEFFEVNVVVDTRKANGLDASSFADREFGQEEGHGWCYDPGDQSLWRNRNPPTTRRNIKTGHVWPPVERRVPTAHHSCVGYSPIGEFALGRYEKFVSNLTVRR